MKSMIHIQEVHNVIEKKGLYAQLAYRVICQVETREYFPLLQLVYKVG